MAAVISDCSAQTSQSLKASVAYWTIPGREISAVLPERLAAPHAGCLRVRPPRHICRKSEEGCGLGLFVRSLVGLDREAAKRAFDGFLAGKTLSANQIEFINLVIDHLTQRGWMDASLLYESPFTDFSPRGVEGVFESSDVARLVAVLDDVRLRAAA